ncbi:HAD family hydrolase [Archangium violaceum]|uniref:HAD family hydrolase n=1 Tax=Archangium violaceum TaxID=83451 RepID=UPI00193B2BBA|nr:HAD family hydrolase [Archangium violaceum]QRK06260.1 HAD family hydrolase [Archangium violaceum]
MLTIFDCDGVLIDSELLAAGVHAELLTGLGFVISQEEVITRFTGLTDAQLRSVVTQQLGRPLPEDYRERSNLAIDRRLESVKPIAGVHALLDRLTGPRCVCSNSSTRRLKISMNAAGLWERFHPHIFSAPEVGRSKPAPDVFLHAARVFGVDPRDTLVIEDSSHGIEGAVAAGMRVIGFTGGGHSWPGHAETLANAGAMKVVSRLEDVGAAIEELSS